jgi:hypothetical protein
MMNYCKASSILIFLMRPKLQFIPMNRDELERAGRIIPKAKRRDNFGSNSPAPWGVFSFGYPVACCGVSISLMLRFRQHIIKTCSKACLRMC